MAKFPSRPQRWMKAVSEAQASLEAIRGTEEGEEIDSLDIANLQAALSDLVSLKEEYQEWRDNMPESMESSPTTEKLDEVLYLDLESAQDYAENEDLTALAESLDDIEAILDDADAVELPRGFGRD